MTRDVTFAERMAEHEHEWEWRWFGLVPSQWRSGKDHTVGLRTCECGELEEVEPTVGKTPARLLIEQRAAEKDEAERKKRREYMAKYKARREAEKSA